MCVCSYSALVCPVAHSLAAKNQSQDTVIATYKRLIRAMPRANQYLLLYVLDLLSVFARKADKNLMTATSTCLHRPVFFCPFYFYVTMSFFFFHVATFVNSSRLN